ncbi:error-prone DNA polymerase [Sneathiella sp. HT1-7]|uniref:error-prone DNA polymerase n=1 Tax=Sneathiella sp. HT1-7 TaxID=2887192 RepID=UPI001D13B51B|nr:error-prone DNA polymerase [Sneathiella sp. HT1-7]MCC3305211.1 error-prone DNA polymerase [Sneathiella sp. HT1-7]
MLRFAELHTTTNFTFLEGASHPEDYVRRAKELGLEAVAITDRNSLAGVVRAYAEARKIGQRIIIGAELLLSDGQCLVALPTDRLAYGRLCRLISCGRRRAEKSQCLIHKEDVLEWAEGMIFILQPPEEINEHFEECLRYWAAHLGPSLYMAAENLLLGHDELQLTRLHAIAGAYKVPVVATNHAMMHVPESRPIADILTCIREHCTIDEAGTRLQKNAERHLKSTEEMLELFTGYEDAVRQSQKISQQITFSLGELKYEYPDEVSNGQDPQTELERLIIQHLPIRYPAHLFPHGVPEKVIELVQRELAVIKELNYAPYFLTIYDIVKFATEQGILCQGRGSAANSVVCYVLGITSVSPERLDMVFERFISVERNEPPDIDVDFEHERREEVIQYIYEKYGRHRAGLSATVICYRARSAIREVGKALGLSQDTLSSMTSLIWGWSTADQGASRAQITAAGLDPDDRRLALCAELSQKIMGYPRHLSQHVGGFIVTKSRLDEIVPIENAAMENRTVIEWDKDDIDTLGILKVDVLGLGMLSCIRRAFELMKTHYGATHTLASLPEGDDAVYDMLCQADSIGVFQVESRAQMSFLPRMKPRNFYDLVIEVAIVRPGPIQGDMVHPYIRRRNGEEKAVYPSKELEGVLSKTLGVPLFQEQAMRIAIVGGGFTPGEADQLRRAMATFRKMGTINSFHNKFIQGMKKNGYDIEFAERCFKQIEGFGEYGFPESHAASFALLVYASAWIKCHHPDVFACALLNSQPMGFYAPAQIIRDAREHGVTVKPPDVNYSAWDSILEPGEGGLMLRLGLRQVRGMNEEDAAWIVAARQNGYVTVRDVWMRAGVKPAALKRLANADAFSSLNLDRREALWQASGIKGEKPLPLFSYAREDEQGLDPDATLPKMHVGENVLQDYRSLRLSLRDHPLKLLRPQFPGTAQSKSLLSVSHKQRVSVAGLVLARQRPGTSKGVVFMTLEDEEGSINVVVWQKVFERFRRAVMTGRLVKISGVLERKDIVTHLIADHIMDYSYYLESLDDENFLKKLSKATPIKGSAVSLHKHPRDMTKALFPSRDFH